MRNSCAFFALRTWEWRCDGMASIWSVGRGIISLSLLFAVLLKRFRLGSSKRMRRPPWHSAEVKVIGLSFSVGLPGGAMLAAPIKRLLVCEITIAPAFPLLILEATENFSLRTSSSERPARYDSGHRGVVRFSQPAFLLIFLCFP